MNQYKEYFDAYLGVKKTPNGHEKKLFQRVEQYIYPLRKIPGIEMIAVCNSLSMYATTKNSDIDLFIITKPKMIWFVRFFITLSLWLQGVWRHGDVIAEHFCLSFFITSETLDLKKIALEDDIYLYYWIYYMKPIVLYGDIYDQFLQKNSWVTVDDLQKRHNLQYAYISNIGKRIHIIHYVLNLCIRFFLKKRTMRSYKKILSPDGIIISDSMLKFHRHDTRRLIHDAILQKNFDKN